MSFRFTIRLVEPVAGTKSTWREVKEQTPDTKFELLDNGYVYDRYSTREEAEEQASIIIRDDRAALIAELQTAKVGVLASAFRGTPEGLAVVQAIESFVQKYK